MRSWFLSADSCLVFFLSFYDFMISKHICMHKIHRVKNKWISGLKEFTEGANTHSTLCETVFTGKEQVW